MVIRHKKKKKFPFFGALLILIGIVWVLQSLGTVGNFPWIGSILILLGIAFVYNRF